MLTLNGIIVFVAAIPVIIAGYLYYKFRAASARLVPGRDVVVLYQVGRGPRAPSVSPFPMKLETFLRMMKVPYMNDHSGKFSKKSKTPWIELNGTVIEDSQLAIEHIKAVYNLDPDPTLTLEQKAVARAFLKLTEENLYWTMCLEMFGDGIETLKSVFPYTGLKLWLTLKLIRRVIFKEAWGHGIGRHSKADVWDIGKRDLDAISNFLGDKPYMMGTSPAEIDCAVFGMLAQTYWHMQGSKHQLYMKEHLPNLVEYIYRMKERFWPDWDHVTLEGERYTPDHGKLYDFKNESVAE